MTLATTRPDVRRIGAEVADGDHDAPKAAR
jgi:hypothetical protein